MQAVILAGGQGTRLRPYTISLPKPLVPVGDHPIIEIILRQLKHYGIREVVISTGHLAELIEAYCGDGRKWSLKIRYVREDQPLSTAGALKLIKGLKGEFLTINGDILCTLDYRRLFEHHLRKRAIATIGVRERVTIVNFGVINLDDEGLVSKYTEKPAYRYLVSMGVNIISRRAVDYIGRKEFLGIPELMARLQASGERVCGFKTDAQWLDIGRPEDYQTAQDLAQSAQFKRLYLR